MQDASVLSSRLLAAPSLCFYSEYSTSTTPLLLLNSKPQDLEDPSPTLRQTEGYRGMDAILALRRRFEHHFLHKMRGDQPRGVPELRLCATHASTRRRDNGSWATAPSAGSGANDGWREGSSETDAK